MDYPKYPLGVSAAYDFYEFMSIGKNGAIPKVILFYQDPKDYLE